MVDYSEYAFRMLCREHGVGLAYSPMLNARLLAQEEKGYAARHWDPGKDEKQLVAQLAGHDPHDLAAAAKLCRVRADAIDFNLGCPQEIARSGRYGAFLLEEEPQLALQCVRALVDASGERPIFVKMRLQLGATPTLDIARRMQDA